MKPTPETMAVYIREDLKALENPHRQDKRIILEDLRRSFRAYAALSKPAADWSAA